MHNIPDYYIINSLYVLFNSYMSNDVQFITL